MRIWHWMLAVMLMLSSVQPAHALSEKVVYAGHVVKKLLLFPVYTTLATPVAICTWIVYGGYEKQLLNDFNDNVLNGVKTTPEAP